MGLCHAAFCVRMLPCIIVSPASLVFFEGKTRSQIGICLIKKKRGKNIAQRILPCLVQLPSHVIFRSWVIRNTSFVERTNWQHLYIETAMMVQCQFHRLKGDCSFSHHRQGSYQKAIDSLAQACTTDPNKGAVETVLAATCSRHFAVIVSIQRVAVRCQKTTRGNVPPGKKKKKKKNKNTR